MPQAGRSAQRTGEGASQPASPSAQAFARHVGHRVPALVEEIARLGLTCTVTIGWASDHRHIIVRCLVLRGGLPDPAERARASFVGGYLCKGLHDLQPRLQFQGAGQNLIIPLP